MIARHVIVRLRFLLLLVVSSPALAQDGAQGLLPIPDYGADFWDRSHLTGDWGRVRTTLANKGIQLDVDWTQFTILPVNTTAFFPLTDELDEKVGIAITGLNYTQFLSEHFALLGGKLDTLDADLNEFAFGRGKSQFMNANFLFDSVAALRLPYSTLGVGALWLPRPNVSLKVSLINTTDSSTTTGSTTSATARPSARSWASSIGWRRYRAA